MRDSDSKAGAARRVIDDMLLVAGERRAREWAIELELRGALAYLNRASAERHARRLLAQGEPRPAVHRRLVAVYGVHKRTAERITERVLRRGPLRDVAAPADPPVHSQEDEDDEHHRLDDRDGERGEDAARPHPDAARPARQPHSLD